MALSPTESYVVGDAVFSRSSWGDWAASAVAASTGELVVSAETPDLGDAREALPVPFEGEPIEIGFNPEFVRDGLESVDGEELVLKLISPLRPGLIEPADSDDFSYLVMPIRLNV